MGALNKVIALNKLKDFEARKERHDRAQACTDEGKLFQAVKLFRENHEWSLANFGQDHATTVYDQETLAYAVSELGHQKEVKNRKEKDEDTTKRIKELFEEARDLDEKALETRTRVEGTNPPSKGFLETQRNLASDYATLEDFKKAARLFHQNYDARRNHPDFGEDHGTTLRAGHELAQCWSRTYMYEKAKILHQKILDTRIRLKASEADIGKSRNAVQYNTKKLEERRKKQEAAKTESAKEEKKDVKEKGKDNKSGQAGAAKSNAKNPTTEKKSENASKDNGKKPGKSNDSAPGSSNGNQSNRINNISKADTTNTPSTPIPEITYKYVDPRHSGINQAGSDTSSVTSGTNTSPTRNIPFRTGSGQGQRPWTPKIVDVDPNTRRDKPRPKSWIAGSADTPQSQPTPATPSGALKPTDNTNISGGRRTRSSSVTPQKDTSKTTPPNEPKRARSSSPPSKPKAPSPSPTPNPYRQLSDAAPGKTDPTSLHDVETWFYTLETETQALLAPLRRDRIKRRIRIAILDTGLDTTHPTFSPFLTGPPSTRRIKALEDFVDEHAEKGTAMDVCGHGTHCAGLLRRVAPEADIYVARVAINFDSSISPTTVVAALQRACRTGKDSTGTKNWDVDIISLSFGFYAFSRPIATAIQEALQKPTLVFAAASNNGTMREVTFPAWLGGVCCVHAAKAGGAGSGFNPEPKGESNLSVLGEGVSSAWLVNDPDNEGDEGGEGKRGEKVMSGTSVATPIMAGIAALVLEYVLQDEPESVLSEQFEDLKHPDGMVEVLGKMVRGRGKWRNVVPWEVLSVRNGRRVVTSFIEHAVRNFRGE